MSTAPHLRVVRGNPDDEELAAVTAVVTALAAARPEPEDRPSRSTWADRSRLVRRPLQHGPGAWRASGLPG